MAVLLHTSRANIYRLIKEKALKAFWYDNEWRIPVEALDEYLSHSYLTPDIHIELEKVLNRAFAVLEKVITMHPLASTYFASFEKINNQLEKIVNAFNRIIERQNSTNS